MNLIEILREQACHRPRALAIIDTYRGRQRETTFAELEAASARAAALFWQKGLRPGDPVLIFQPMSLELYIALSALFRLGLVAMFLDPAYGRTYLEHCCALGRPQALVASTKAHVLRLVSPPLRRIPHKFVIGRPLPGATLLPQSGYVPDHQDIVPCSDHAPALLTFTSGSTGRPKAALRTHGFLLAQHRALARSLQLTTGQLDLTTMPIVALANLASGVTCFIPNVDLRAPGAVNPGPVVAHLQNQRIDRSVASPALLDRLARYCLQRSLTLPDLRQVFTGGGPVFPRLLEQLQRIAPNAQITGIYGSTEAEPIARISYDQIQPADRQTMRGGRGVLAGCPVETIKLRIIPDRWGTPLGPLTEAAFAALSLRPGAVGEIVVSGDHVLSGYVDEQENVITKIRVGQTTWHRTGDAGYLDDTGRLWLLGRCAARVEDGRGLLYPLAVEGVVSESSAVRRSAVVSQRGRRILLIEPYDDLPSHFDAKALEENLAWAPIDEVKRLRHIPVDRRHNAKVDYEALEGLLARG